MSSKSAIMVIGATGNIGAATINALASNYADNFEIRAGVRDPDRAAENFKQFEGRVKIVKATMGDDSLTNRLRGVSRLFIVTPGVKNRVDLVIKTAQSAKRADVKFIMVLSGSVADYPSTFAGLQFKEIETVIKELGVPYTFLRVGFFAENYLAFRDSIVNQSSIYMPLDPTKPFTPMVVSDAGKAAAAVLAEPKRHYGKTYTIVSNRHTMNDLCDELSRQLGKPIKYIRTSYEDTKKGLEQVGVIGWQVDVLIDFYQKVDNGSRMANQSDLGDYQKITGTPPTSLQDWVSSHANAFQ